MNKQTIKSVTVIHAIERLAPATDLPCCIGCGQVIFACQEVAIRKGEGRWGVQCLIHLDCREEV